MLLWRSTKRARNPLLSLRQKLPAHVLHHVGIIQMDYRPWEPVSLAAQGKSSRLGSRNLFHLFQWLFRSSFLYIMRWKKLGGTALRTRFMVLMDNVTHGTYCLPTDLYSNFLSVLTPVFLVMTFCLFLWFGFIVSTFKVSSNSLWNEVGNALNELSY